MSFVAKKETTTWFRADCFQCRNFGTCLAGSTMNLSVEEYVKRLSGQGQRTMEMVQGQIFHEQATKGVPTIDEYGVKTFKRDLANGKRIVLREVKMCSRFRMGLRGTVDKLTMQKIGKNHFAIQMQENKSHIFLRSYLRQTTHYGLIVSAHDFEIVYRCEKEDRCEMRGFRIYPPNSILDVDLVLRIGLDKRGAPPKYYYYPFMRENHSPSDPYSANWVRAQIANHERHANGYVKKRKIGSKLQKTRILGLRDMHRYGGFAFANWVIDESDPRKKIRVVQAKFGKTKLLTQAKIYNVMYRKLKPLGKVEEAKVSQPTAETIDRYSEG